MVTGGSRGIGAETAYLLSKQGYKVVIGYLKNDEAAENTVKRISDGGGIAVAVKGDVSDERDVKNLFDAARDLGQLTLLVNNAGISCICLLQDMPLDEIKRVIQVDLLGTVLCSKEAARLMVPAKFGSIINVSSMWGETGASCETVYSACKAGIIGFTKALAQELGPSGIRVNCVSPGVIDTEMNASLTEDDLSALIESTPLSRIGTVKDVAEAVVYLASEKSSFITGQVLSVNGGIVI